MVEEQQVPEETQEVQVEEVQTAPTPRAYIYAAYDECESCQG